MQKDGRIDLRASLVRIHSLMDRYFDALELNLQNKDYLFSQRERDAQLFNTLAHTLTRLFKLNELTQTGTEKEEDDEIRTRLEARLSKLVEQTANTNISERIECR